MVMEFVVQPSWTWHSCHGQLASTEFWTKTSSRCILFLPWQSWWEFWVGKHAAAGRVCPSARRTPPSSQSCTIAVHVRKREINLEEDINVMQKNPQYFKQIKRCDLHGAWRKISFWLMLKVPFMCVFFLGLHLENFTSAVWIWRSSKINWLHLKLHIKPFFFYQRTTKKPSITYSSHYFISHY